MAGIKGRLARLKTSAKTGWKLGEGAAPDSGTESGAASGSETVVATGIEPGAKSGSTDAFYQRTFLPGWQRLSEGLYERIRSTSLCIDEGKNLSFDSRPFFPKKNIRLSLGGADRTKTARIPGLNPAEAHTQYSADYEAVLDDGTAGFPAELRISFSEVSFFDLETTGLSGGTGTLAFLAAVGYFNEGALQIHQLFIDDFPAEGDFLSRLVELLAQRPNIVSFNGASFDLPLLRTRCVLNGLKVPDFFHIDALRLSRRLWKKTLGSCSLQSLEEAILGLSRQDDVPGFLIPRIWLDFVKSERRTEESNSVMERVVEHNSLDVRNLARLFLIMDRIFLDSGSRWRELRADPLGLARELFALGNKERALDLLYEAGDYGSQEAFALLARIHRRSRNAEACREVLRRLEGRSFQVCIEMAKCYEHVEKDPLRALELAQAAVSLAQIEERRLSTLEKEGLGKRLKRLRKKLAIDQP